MQETTKFQLIPLTIVVGIWKARPSIHTVTVSCCAGGLRLITLAPDGIPWGAPIVAPIDGMYAGGVVRGCPCGAGEGLAGAEPGNGEEVCQFPGGWWGGGPADSVAGMSGAGKAGGGALGRDVAILSRRVCMF